ncbi:unnamed protein product [Brassicogethes aeneus]|uniref:Alpha-mannosidase n=1 Tax=Brassicogethes aeneus TaxID=1431903 RepID=A0A9P0F8J8_BRAAE|nr:unnamed protein product [Brassicogethes aeneus]
MLMFKFCIVLVVGLAGVMAKPAPLTQEPSCGYESCHPIDDKKINIHLVPHSHDDVGWLKTVDQYFYGAKTEIQSAGVQYIITSAVEALLRNRDRRYIQVETEFFKKWWDEATESQREDFQNLVNRGQIEMINGAIAMNDEACTNYQSTIDQFTWGLRFLNDTLGACGAPKIGWQIDPFGHSREQANLFTQFGYNGFFFARLDENDRLHRKANKRMDFLWQGSDNIESSNIFGSVFGSDNLYFPPQDLNWDVGETNDPIIDNPSSPDYNVPFFLKSVQNTVNRYKKWFPTNNLLFTMGGDFQYQSAEMLYMNMDRLIKIFKNHTEINVIYSTPSCYLKAVNDAKPNLTLKTDDFFPYGNSDHEYWAGYFTSRPNSKRFERVGNNILQATKQLTALSKILSGHDFTDDVNDLREQMGIMQHHDAITGTEKQNVTKDYVRRLTKGIRNAEKHFSEILGSFVTSDNKDILLNLDLQTCLLSNVSICTTAEKNVIVVYNPLSRPVSHYVRIPVPEGSYKVYDAESKPVHCDILPAISKFKHIPKEVGTPLPYDLVFEAKINAFGMYVYYLKKTGDNTKPGSSVKTQTKFGSSENGFELNPETNLLKSVTIDGVTVDIKQEFLYYQSAKKDIWSGAYLFRPLPETVAISLSETVYIESVSSTTSVDEVVQVFNDYIKQIIRVYKAPGHNYVEFDWLVGPLPNLTLPNMGNEVITRFTVADFDNKNVFYTDSNGRQLMRREINKRPDYTYNHTYEPIASNYYPVTSRILIRDEAKNLEVAILNDRSQGGSSLNQGEIELMVHRRLFHDDNKGVNENLNETEFGQGVVVRGSHLLTLGPITTTNKNQKNAETKEKIRELKKLLSPIVFVAPTDKTKEEIFKVINENSFIYAGGSNNNPEGVHVMTFEPWKEDSYILRLENIFDAANSTVSVDLNKIFLNIKFNSIKETTLAANHWLDDYKKIPKFSWSTDVKDTSGWTVDMSQDDGTKITLTPTEIRTFIVKV